MIKNDPLGFEHNGVWITNPNFDETGRFVVDNDYYPADKVAQYWIDYRTAGSRRSAWQLETGASD